MRLKLNNVRQHKDIELVFPDTGLVMLRGISGAGKTTILDAIEDVLYGKMKNIKPYGGGNPIIEFEINNMRLKRTRTPNTYTFTDLLVDLILKDDAGEEEVGKRLGMNYDEFLACSYIKQGMSNSLLDLEPMAMMEFIQRLCSKTIDPEIVREKINERIKLHKQTLTAAHIKHDQNMFAKQALMDNLTDRPVGPSEIHPANIDLLSQKTADIKKIMAAKDKHDENVKDINRLKNEISKLEALKSQHDDKLAQLEKTPVENVDDRYNKLLLKRDYTNKINQLKDLAVEVQSIYPETKQHTGKISDFIDQKIIEIGSMLVDLKEKIQKTLNVINDHKNTQNAMNCPECQSTLYLIKGNLHKGKPFVSIVDDEKEYKNLLLEEKQHQSAIDKLRNIATKANMIKATAGKDPYPEIKSAELSTEIEKIKGLREFQTILNKQIIETKGEISTCTSKLAVFNEEIAKKDISSDMDSIDKEDLATQLEKMKQEIEQITQHNADHKRYKEQLQVYEKQVANIAEYDVLITKTQVDVRSAERLLAAAEKLKMRSDSAALSAIEMKIEEINQCAAYFVDRMFELDGTVIKICNYSKNASGEEKTKMGVEIHHKGFANVKRASMSKGEKSRACLAFQLGLSELYNSPILLIDEGFSGLNESLLEHCLSVLKDFAINRLVIVIEHNAPESMFDEVIDVT